MLSIQQCRELIPDNEKYTDVEITKTRDTLEAFADIAFDMWLKDRKKNSGK